MKRQDNSKNQAVVTYLQQPGLRRLLKAIARKYHSLGRVGGTIQLNKLTADEQETIGGLLSRDLRNMENLRVHLQNLDEVFRASRFALSLEGVLAVYLGEKLSTKQQELAEQEQQWEQLFRAAKALAVREQTVQWVEQLKNRQDYGYRTFLSMYQDDQGQAKLLLNTCIRALDNLPFYSGQRSRRPVFAAWLTGNPHGLDRDEALGRLLYQGILFVLGLSKGESQAEKMRAVFKQAGLEDDDLSSNVTVLGLKLLPADPRFQIFHQSNSTMAPLTLPLRFFDQPLQWAPGKRVYVVENPTVFSAILDQWPQPTPPPLICSSGQPSVAALQLLDQLSAAGAELYYSGDFDGKGLEIALGLWRRYPTKFRPWFLDTATYQQASKGVALSEDQRRRITSLDIPWAPELSSHLLASGYVVYQETLVQQMVEWLMKEGL